MSAHLSPRPISVTSLSSALDTLEEKPDTAGLKSLLLFVQAVDRLQPMVDPFGHRDYPRLVYRSTFMQVSRSTG
jgi:hypothetical protein